MSKPVVIGQSEEAPAAPAARRLRRILNGPGLHAF
jgi:hypothetical protein